MEFEWINIEDSGTLLSFQSNDGFASEIVTLDFEFPFSMRIIHL